MLRFLYKNQASGCSPPLVSIPLFRDNPALCPVVMLKAYLACTSLSTHRDYVFIHLTSSLAAGRLNYWVVQAISAANVHGAVIRAHDVRKFAFSMTWARCADLQHILLYGFWSSTHQFFGPLPRVLPFCSSCLCSSRVDCLNCTSILQCFFKCHVPSVFLMSCVLFYTVPLVCGALETLCLTKHVCPVFMCSFLGTPESRGFHPCGNHGFQISLRYYGESYATSSTFFHVFCFLLYTLYIPGHSCVFLFCIVYIFVTVLYCIYFCHTVSDTRARVMLPVARFFTFSVSCCIHCIYLATVAFFCFVLYIFLSLFCIVYIFVIQFMFLYAVCSFVVYHVFSVPYEKIIQYVTFTHFVFLTLQHTQLASCRLILEKYNRSYSNLQTDKQPLIKGTQITVILFRVQRIRTNVIATRVGIVFVTWDIWNHEFSFLSVSSCTQLRRLIAGFVLLASLAEFLFCFGRRYHRPSRHLVFVSEFCSLPALLSPGTRLSFYPHAMLCMGSLTSFVQVVTSCLACHCFRRGSAWPFVLDCTLLLMPFSRLLSPYVFTTTKPQFFSRPVLSP